MNIWLTAAFVTLFSYFVLKKRKTIDWKTYKGKWAFVTGCTSGIGREFALQLADKGMNLYLVARNKEELVALSEIIKSKGVQVKVLVVDLSVDFSFQVQDEISVLINNAGMVNEYPQFFTEVSKQITDKIMAVNMNSVIKITHQLLQNNLKEGLILNVGSFCAECPTSLLSVYSGTKAFLKVWSEALHFELKPKIHVELLNTMFVSTKMSKRKESYFVPSPKTYVRYALDRVGNSYFCTPASSHWYMNAFFNFIPFQFSGKLIFDSMKATRSKALSRLK